MNHEPQKILIIRLSSLGDVLLTTPLIRLLRKRFPNVAIDFVVKKKYVDVLRANPHLDKVFSFDDSLGFFELKHLKQRIRRQQYDTVIDLHKNFRSWYLRTFLGKIHLFKYSKFRIKRFSLIKFGINLFKKITPIHRRYISAVSKLGIEDDNQGLELFLDSEVAGSMAARLKQNNMVLKHPVVGVAGGASYDTKRWLPDRYGEVVRRLGKIDGASVFLFGDKNDKAVTDEIEKVTDAPMVNFTGQLTLMETACAMASCDVVLSNDTGLMHMATALGKKVVAIFGPTTKELGFFPVGSQNTVIEIDLHCRPCSHVGTRKCPQGHFRCMREISVDEVYAAVKKFIGG